MSVRAEEVRGAMEAESLDDYWDYQTSISGPIGELVAGLSPADGAAIRAEFTAAAE